MQHFSQYRGAEKHEIMSNTHLADVKWFRKDGNRICSETNSRNLYVSFGLCSISAGLDLPGERAAAEGPRRQGAGGHLLPPLHQIQVRPQLVI